MDTLSQSFTFSQRAQKLSGSAIREILKVTARPEIISFAGGLPTPVGFPVEEMQSAFNKVLSEQGRVALQYTTTEGYLPLRQWLADQMSAEGSPVSADEILLVNGSQQALDMLGKLFIDEGSKVLVESPTYLGALQALSLYGPSFVAIPTDGQGMLPEYVSSPEAMGARLLYALPNFQNPTGLRLPLERRLDLVERCAAAHIPIVEDDPYGELRYAGERLPSLLSLGRKAGATVIRLGTFSKVLAPGLRLGYIVAPVKIIDKLVQIKQATDLHTSTLTQMAVYEAVHNGFLDKHLPKVRDIYQKQCAIMLDAMDQHFPDTAQWTRPEGGMFIWVTLPEHVNSTALLQKAIENLVAFVPGEPFYAGDDVKHNTLRLSFATVPEEKIREGIAILGKLIKAA